ncbi:MAG: hypothetical protein V3V59_06795 [Thermodesulfovibrionales bacterium]
MQEHLRITACPGEEFLALLVAGFTISFQIMKAALADPVESLRHE